MPIFTQMGTLRSGEVASELSDRAREGAELRVLLLDGDPDGRDWLKSLVEGGSRSMTCDVVGTLEEASHRVAEEAHDAYLLAHWQHLDTGMAAVARLANRAGGPIVLVADVENENADRLALEAGAADFLVKDDLTPQAVQRSIRYAVETWRERRRAEEGFRKYLSLFDAVPVGLFRIDRDGALIEVNQTLVRMLGYELKTELLGRQARELVASGGAKQLSVPSIGTPGNEVEVVTKGGSTRWVSVTLEEIRDDSGELAHYEGAAVDVTERRKAEARVSVRDKLLDQVPCAVIVTDMAGVCMLWNRHAEKMYGWSAGEAVGRHIQELTVLDEQASFSAEIMETIAEEGHWEGEFQVRRKDGSTFLAQVSDSMVYDRAGEPIGIVGVSLDLTETRAAEDELRHYQELATAAYDDSAVAKAVVSLHEGRLVSANRALYDMLGYDYDTLIGRHFADFTHPEDIDADLSQFKRLLDREIDSYSIDKRYLRPDGSIVWGRLQASIIGGDDGPEYVLGQVVDISERKEAEDRLAFQASLLQQMRTPVVATDLAGRVTHWNRQAEQAYGWTVDEALGKTFVELVLPELGPEQQSVMTTSLRETGLWEGELVITRKDGSRFPAWASGAVVRDGRGRPAGIVGALVDLSDVESARAEARTQEMLSHSLLEAVSVPIAVFTQTGEMVAANPSWRTTTGEATHPYLPDCVHENPDPEVMDEIASGVEGVLAGAEERFSFEFSCLTDEGERWIRAVAVAIEGGGGVVTHWDITDERFARVALEETIRAKDEFITSVSHELRTPLSVVVGLAETLRSGLYAESERAEFHDLIADQAQEMALIVEDLLVAGRIENDTLTVRTASVDLEEELNAVIRPWDQKDDIDLQIRLRPGADTVYADPLRVRQILRNLLTNAARYGEPPIEIRAVRARQRVIISISDHGEGIPERALERMFQPYARFGDNEGRPSSVGLGLYVARRLARLMDGDLVYKSDADLTTFLVTLPAQPPAAVGRTGDGKRFMVA